MEQLKNLSVTKLGEPLAVSTEAVVEPEAAPVVEPVAEPQAETVVEPVVEQDVAPKTDNTQEKS